MSGIHVIVENGSHQDSQAVISGRGPSMEFDEKLTAAACLGVDEGGPAVAGAVAGPRFCGGLHAGMRGAVCSRGVVCGGGAIAIIAGWTLALGTGCGSSSGPGSSIAGCAQTH